MLLFKQQIVDRRWYSLRDWLKQKRLDYKLTQQDVAKKLGITTQYYQLIESNQRQNKLDFSLVIKLSDIFDMDMSEIARLEEL